MNDVVNTPSDTNDGWLNEDELYKCVHCGFCLQSCPTYLGTGLETESPRGRIALMKAVNEGRIEIDSGVLRHWDLCIQCRACESVCPSGVPYGNLIETVMEKVQTKRKMSFLSKILFDVTLKHIIPSQKLLQLSSTLLFVYIKSGLQKVVRFTNVLAIFPPSVRNLDSKAPSFNGKSFRSDGRVYHSRSAKKERISLLSGCIMPIVQGDQMRSAVQVLNTNGFEVYVPQDQVCCGAINSHVGDTERARDLARKNIDAFSEELDTPIVTVSAGCGARMKEYHHLLKDDDLYAGKALLFESRVVDVHEILDNVSEVRPRGEIEKKITYQDSCHLSNAQGIRRQPRDLIKCIKGVEFVEMPGSEICCGAGGTYMITEPEMSDKVLLAKIARIKDMGVDIVATANPGCFMQLESGVKREGLNVEVKYVTDLLSEAYMKEK